MRWDVAISKTVGSGAHRFHLDVAFRSDVDRLVLFGPSGAGKTMTLKAIAGLVRPEPDTTAGADPAKESVTVWVMRLPALSA